MTKVTSEHIIEDQTRYECPVRVNEDANGIIKKGERIWIPED